MKSIKFQVWFLVLGIGVLLFLMPPTVWAAGDMASQGMDSLSLAIDDNGFPYLGMPCCRGLIDIPVIRANQAKAQYNLGVAYGLGEGFPRIM